MLLRVRFEDPLTINVNVTITQKDDPRVAVLEKQMEDWLKKIDDGTKKLEVVADTVK